MNDYRQQLQSACFDYVWNDRGGEVSLLLYDVTTLYFEAEKEDGLRKVGYNKERRVDPQIVVGLLVDRSGFPLEIGCFEGNKAESLTLLPVVQRFQQAHQIADMVVVADAGMLSEANLKALDEMGLRFIVGSRLTKAPHDLEAHFYYRGDGFANGQIIDTITRRRRHPRTTGYPRALVTGWDPEEHPDTWRAVWQYSRNRAVRDNQTLTQQRNRAHEIIDGVRVAKKARFLKTGPVKDYVFDDAAYQRAISLIGLKGYVTNIPPHVMSATEIITSYHDLWRVKQSFRMSKTDLADRPIFHHTRDAIETHLTIVLAALAIARDLQTRTNTSLKKIIHALRPLKHVTIHIGEHQLEAEPTINDNTHQILQALGH